MLKGKHMAVCLSASHVTAPCTYGYEELFAPLVAFKTSGEI